MTDSDPSAEPPGNHGLLFELWLIKQAVYPLIETAIRDTGLSADQYGLLLLVERLQPVSPGEVARHCGMRINTGSAALQRLERRGLLDRRSNEDDARSVLVSTSDEGARTIERAIALAEVALARITPLVDGIAVAAAVDELNRAFRLVANLPTEPPRRLPDAAVAPAAHVMFELWLMKQAVYPLLEQSTAAGGLSADDLGLGLLIQRLRAATPGELVRHTGMRANNLSAALGRLERKGLIERAPNERDARSVLVALTPAGHDVARAAAAYHDHLCERLGPAPFVEEAERRLAELNRAIRSAAGLASLEDRTALPGAEPASS